MKSQAFDSYGTKVSVDTFISVALPSRRLLRTTNNIRHIGQPSGDQAIGPVLAPSDMQIALAVFETICS